MSTTALTGHVDDVLNVNAQPIDANGRTSTDQVVWSSSNAAVGKVEKHGDGTQGAVIYCLTAGSCTITAQAGSATATFALTVNVPTPGPTATVILTVTPQNSDE